MTFEPHRRTFLRGLVSLPLIGGGVTLIGAPTAPVPLVQAAALPAFASPHDRACYAWEAFSGAMREITAGADGWCVLGGGERLTALPHLPASSFLRLASIHYETDTDLRFRAPFIIEKHRDLYLSGFSPGGNLLAREIR